MPCAARRHTKTIPRIRVESAPVDPDGPVKAPSPGLRDDRRSLSRNVTGSQITHRVHPSGGFHTYPGSEGWYRDHQHSLMWARLCEVMKTGSGLGDARPILATKSARRIARALDAWHTVGSGQRVECSGVAQGPARVPHD